MMWIEILLAVILAPIALGMLIRLFCMPVFWGLLILSGIGVCLFPWALNSYQEMLSRPARLRAAAETQIKDHDRAIAIYKRANDWRSRVAGKNPFEGTAEHAADAKWIADFYDYVANGGNINVYTKEQLDTAERLLDALDEFSKIHDPWQLR
jgi:hypothetical protein